VLLASSCVAVGYSGGAARAEWWNGTGWTLLAPPTPRATTASGLNAVACPATTTCVAVGYSDATSGSTQTLAEIWTGRALKIQRSPNLRGPTDSRLTALSCSAPDACVAVGSSGPTGTAIQAPLAESWNGTVWKIQHVPVPPSANYSGLKGVSCTSASDCIAVGYYHQLTIPADEPLVEVWNGGTWAPQSSPAWTFNMDTNLSAISCSSSVQCTAVGYVGRETLAVTWDGTSWAVQPTPNAPNEAWSELLAVSCASPSFCGAVGYSSNGSFKALGEAWDGTSWTLESVASRSGAKWAHLAGISCTSPVSCTAVGYYADASGQYLPVAETWDGTAWSLRDTPRPADALDSKLFSVSCESPTHCVGVGAFHGTGSSTALVENWDGAAWTVEPAPPPAGNNGSYLNQVSCAPPPAECMAVGTYSAQGTTTTFSESGS
jgi:hypothetical protein